MWIIHLSNLGFCWSVRVRAQHKAHRVLKLLPKRHFSAVGRALGYIGEQKLTRFNYATEEERWREMNQGGGSGKGKQMQNRKLSSYLSDYLLPQQSCLLLLLLPWWWPTLDHNRTVFLSDALKQAWALWNQIGYVYFSKVVRIFISPTFTWNRWLFFSRFSFLYRHLMEMRDTSYSTSF